jgi:hypothetical protein
MRTAITAFEMTIGCVLLACLGAYIFQGVVMMADAVL